MNPSSMPNQPSSQPGYSGICQHSCRAEVPSTPIKPNKKIIMAVGVVFGGMLGVFAALIRSMIRRRKSVSAQ